MDGARTLEVVFHEFKRQCLRGTGRGEGGAIRGNLQIVVLQPACGLSAFSKQKT